MSDENEIVVIRNPLSPQEQVGVPPSASHVHHGREVIVKAGEREIVLGPLHASGDASIGKDHTHRYVRTEDKDDQGRAIFKRADAV